MVSVLFGDDYGGTYTKTFETEEEAKAFANMEIRKLTILEIKNVDESQ